MEYQPDVFRILRIIRQSARSCHVRVARIATVRWRPQIVSVLENFIVDNRDSILALARRRVASRAVPRATEVELKNGIPVFLDQLGDALRLAKKGPLIDHGAIGKSGTLHGGDLLRMGLTIGQVVHDYGDICQAITELAQTRDAPITGIEFQTLNLCLDDAIAAAVTEYARQRERTIEHEGTERLGILTHELRNLLGTAMLSFESIRAGHVAPAGSTGALHLRSLLGLRGLVDRTLAEVRLEAGIDRQERILAAEFVEEVEIGALLQAKARGLHFAVAPLDAKVAVQGDRQILAAALANLLQNAFKFTKKGGSVVLTPRVTDERVLFDVEDECGGLPPGKTEELFRSFEQRGKDRTGVGLGLAITLKAAHASSGEIRVRDIPGRGCVFTLDLPRAP